MGHTGGLGSRRRRQHDQCSTHHWVARQIEDFAPKWPSCRTRTMPCPVGITLPEVWAMSRSMKCRECHQCHQNASIFQPSQDVWRWAWCDRSVTSRCRWISPDPPTADHWVVIIQYHMWKTAWGDPFSGMNHALTKYKTCKISTLAKSEIFLA